MAFGFAQAHKVDPIVTKIQRDNVHPHGQSENPLSPFYTNQVDLYIGGKYRKVALERSEIEVVVKGRLKLR